jgi:hypothetical protein
MRFPRAIGLIFAGFAVAVAVCPRAHSQAALLLEDADGISRALDPTGHDAVYFARICAASSTRLRRCALGEQGVVISRYEGLAGYDWLAVPLIPYLYSLDNPHAVPGRVDQQTVHSLRQQYHEAHLMALGRNVPEGGRIQRGWNQLVGAAYERRMYAFRFETTEAQDDAFIAWMNAGTNHSHFNIMFRNCANFADQVLDFYFPHTFRRHIVPDGGIVTPRQVAYELVRYARRHPQVDLTVLEIPQVPGYRRPSRPGKSVAGSLTVTGYVIPVAVLNPIVAAGLIADYLAWGRYPLPLKQAQVLSPETMAALAGSTDTTLANRSDRLLDGEGHGEGLEANTARAGRR